MCGLAGVFLPASAPAEAAVLTALALHEQQHRGQDGVGITSYGRPKGRKKTTFYSKKSPGLVGDTFTKKRRLNKLRGNVAIGHVRYATSGKKIREIYSIQPMYGGRDHNFALAHNGHMPDGKKLRKLLVEEKHARLQSTVDTEIFVEYIVRSKKSTIEEKLLEVCARIDGSYSLVVLAPNKLIGLRDPNGFRPLVLGRLRNGGYTLASETCAFPIMDAEFVRHIKPGEMIVIDESGLKSFQLEKTASGITPCIFESVYFSRPDSILESGEDGLTVRERLGAILAKEVNLSADCVIPVPDSAIHAANGFSEESGIPVSLALVRNHYVGRMFIAPNQKARNFGLKLKHSVVASAIAGKEVIIIDDSIVRGDTIQNIVELIRVHGPKKIHVAVTYPMYQYPCLYGIATPTKEELQANRHDLDAEKIRKSIGVDSLHFLSYQGLFRAVTPDRQHPCTFCDACATGNYPIPKTR